MKYLQNLDLTGFELRNAKIHNLATAPTAAESLMYYDTVKHDAFIYDGTSWVNITPSGAQAIALINAAAGATIVDTILSTNANDAITKRHTQNTDNTLTSTIATTISTSGVGNIVDFKVGATVKASVDATGKYIGTIDWASINSKPTSTASAIDTAVTNSHTHSNKALLDSYTQTDANISSAISAKHTQNTDSVLTTAVVTGNTINNTNASPTSLVVFQNNGTSKATVDANGKFTGTLDWANINSKPTSTTANIDTAVTNSHTHSNKALLDTYTQTDVNISDAVSKRHSQNTDNTLTNAAANTIANTTATGNIVDFKGNGSIKSSIDSTGKFTGTVDWANLNNKPTSTTANIDTAVTNNHTHGNKALLDTYTQTDANIASAVSLKHTQNTDSGTTSTTFQLDSGNAGPKLKNNASVVEVRNSVDNAYADLRVGNLYVQGSTTTINSNIISLGDSELELNTDVTTNAMNSDGGLTIKRLAADNVTRADAKITFNNTSGRWQADFGATSAPQVAVPIANVINFTIGDGTTTSFNLTHNLGTRNVMVSVRHAISPYDQVIVDNNSTDLNNVNVAFGSAPATNEYIVTIMG